MGVPNLAPQGAPGDVTSKGYVDARPINAQVGTSYTLVGTDLGKIVTLTNSAAITLTVNGSLDLLPGQSIIIAQRGAGQVTVASSGATVNARPGNKLGGQYAYAELICISADVYDLVGDLVA